MTVLDDGLFDELYSFFYREMENERVHANSQAIGSASSVRIGWWNEDQRVDREVFERTLLGLTPLMEEGLVEIGVVTQRIRRTSFGFCEIDHPRRPISETLAAIRKDYDERGGEGEANGHNDVGVVWNVQATTAGWEWANKLMSSIPMDVFNKEQGDFYGE